jgi:hypothetical protein
MTWPVTVVRKFRMREADARTYAESEIQSQAETGKVHNGEWKPLCGYEVFDVVYWSNEEGKASPNEKIGVHDSARYLWKTHPNMTSMLPRLWVRWDEMNRGV